MSYRVSYLAFHSPVSMATATSGLYRSLLRNAKAIKDYNYRSYAVRKVKTGFQQGRSLSGEQAASSMKFGNEQLAFLQRFSTISQQYPAARSVMEQSEVP